MSNPMIKAMVAAGYVCSPNNVYGVPGQIMYAGGPGLPEFPKELEVEVGSDRIRVFSSKLFGEPYTRKTYLDTVTVAVFEGVEEFLAAAPNVSEPGLPAYSNAPD